MTITLDNKDNPSNIYESLNFKNEQLEDSDLIRNYIFMKVKTSRQDSFYNTIWKSFEEMFFDLGLDNQESKEQITDFFYKYLIAKDTYFPKKTLYTQFTTFLDDELDTQKEDLINVVNDLKKFGNYYLAITHPSKKAPKELSAVIKRFKKLEVDTAIPLILKFYERYEQDKNTSSKDSALSNFNYKLSLVESFIMRRSILRMRTRGYGLDFAQAKEFSDNIVGLIRFFYNKGWPDDEEIRKHLPDFPIYNHEPKKTNLILTTIEKNFGHKEPVDLEQQTITIEHIMPQNLNSYWINMLGDDAEKTHSKYLHTIGNLTLTGFNSELGAKSFEDKRDLYKTSHLELNRYFDDVETWTKDDIFNRAMYIVEKFIEIWEIPEITLESQKQNKTKPPAEKNLQFPLKLDG